MKLIMTLIHQNNLYNCVFEHNKNITVSEAYGADVCVPDISDPIRIGWDTVRSEIAVSCGNNKKWVGFNHPLSMNNANAVFYFSKLMPVSCKFSVQTSCLIQVGTGSVSSEKQIDMSIAVPTLLENYLRIENRAGAVYVYDENCANRLYVNGKRISTAKLYDGDIISVAFLQIVFVRGYFYVRNVSGEAISVANGKLAYYKVASTNRNEDLFIPKSPRLVEKVAQEVIALEKPPQAGGPPQINWLNILIMPICSITLMAVLVILMGMSPIMLIMSGTMTVISLILAVVNYFKQTKQHKSYSGLIDEKYQAYLAEMQEKIQQSKNRQLTVLLHDNPSPDECVQLATDRSTRLWERTLDDEDFMRVRIGLGTIHSAVIGTYQRPQIVLEENELENKAIEIAENSRMVENAPILCDLSAQKLIGFVGERSASTEMLRCMVTELCAQHSYDELKVVAIVPENEVTQWAWLRWLPHCADNQRQKNYLFTSLGDAESVLTEIDAELTHRNMEDQRTRTTSDLIPHYLVISAKQGVLEHHAVWSNLVSDDHLGCTTLLAYNKLTALPSLCGTIIEANGGFGTMYSRTESFPKQAFQCDRCSVEQADRFARALAPLVTETSGSANLPMVVSFLDGYGVSTPEELKIAQRWEKAKTYKSMAVPIAALSGGTPFAFDINEKKHGVHGLVAGMSGSGKTEMVQTWLLSLAVHFSPEDLNFVLIDFKGTGMIAPFQEIPHLAGSISNLDSREDINRNLKSLKNEIERRERILNEYLAKGKNIDPSDININKLNKAYDNGLVPEKLPVLIVAIDEFAEFKMQYPDFGKAIESLLATGRSLGIFIVLMTQNPAGVVSGLMESNIRYRWCLRVANHAASREMLGCADASKITNPGRAFVKVGEQLFEEVQSYYSKAPYMPEKHKHDQTQAMIRILAPNRNVIFSESTNRRENEQSGKTEIGVIVQHIIDLGDAKGIPSAKKVWLDKLPEQLSLDQVLSGTFDGRRWPGATNSDVVVGLADDPDSQQQYPFALNLERDGHLLIYGAPVTGKTTLLQTFLLSTALTRRPDEVNMYILDFGGWNMNVLADLPHVGGIAYDSEPERIKKLTTLLADIMAERKQRFSRAGVGNISDFRELTGASIADIILAVDNFGPVLKLYQDLDDFFATLVSNGASLGVYLVATAGSHNAVPYKLSQMIKNAVALQMNSLSDYSDIVGKVKDELPPIKGRGYAKGALTFQAAIPVPGEGVKEIRNAMQTIVKAMSDSWSGSLPLPIPEIPERIHYGSVNTPNVALGLSIEKVMPVSYDYTKQHYLLISGTGQSGKSKLLQVVTRQLLEKLGGQLYVFDVKNSGLPSVRPMARAYLTTAQQIDQFIEDLRPELQNRLTQKKADPTVNFAPIVIAIDDYESFFSAVSNDTITRLNAIIKIGTGLGLYLIAAGDAFGVASLVNKGEAVAHAMSHSKQLVMLGGCMNDHCTVSVKVSYSQKSEQLNDREGYFIGADGAVRFKTMEPYVEVTR